MDNFDLKKYLAKGRIHEDLDGSSVDYERYYYMYKDEVMDDMGYDEDDMEDGSIEDEVNRATERRFADKFGEDKLDMLFLN